MNALVARLKQSAAGKVCANTTNAFVCQGTPERTVLKKLNAQKIVPVTASVKMGVAIAAPHSAAWIVTQAKHAQMDVQKEVYV